MHFIPSFGVKGHPIHRMCFQNQELYRDNIKRKKKNNKYRVLIS